MADAPAADMQDRMRALRQRFAERLARDIALLRALADSQDAADRVADLAHKLAGTAGTFGHPGVSRAAGALERAILSEPAIPLTDRTEFGVLLAAIDEAIADPA